jgi:SAM-dependent methyltransferase
MQLENLQVVKWTGDGTINSDWMKVQWKKFSSSVGIHVPDDGSCSEDDWLPTPHGLMMAQNLRSHPLLHTAFKDLDVVELGGGVGNHTVLLWKQKVKSLLVTEITSERLKATAEALASSFCVGNTLHLQVADWLVVKPKTEDGKFDAVVTNPPFCQSGMFNRRYFIDELILNSYKLLRPGGLLVFSQSSMADIQLTLHGLRKNGYEAEVLSAHEFPWRDYYLEDPTFLEEAKQVPDGFRLTESGVRMETLYTIKAKLLDWNPLIVH